jgi:hypothetical protein
MDYIIKKNLKSVDGSSDKKPSALVFLEVGREVFGVISLTLFVWLSVVIWL